MERELRLAASIARVKSKMPVESAKREWARFLRDESKLCIDFSSEVLAAEGEKIAETAKVIEESTSLQNKLKAEAKIAVSNIMTAIGKDLEGRCTLPGEGKASWKADVPVKCTWKVLMETAGPLTADQRVHDLNAKYKKAIEGHELAIKFCERFNLEEVPEMKNTKALMATTLVTLSEMVLVSTVEDSELNAETRKKKIQNVFDKLATGSSTYEAKLRERVHPMIIRETYDKLTSKDEIGRTPAASK